MISRRLKEHSAKYRWKKGEFFKGIFVYWGKKKVSLWFECRFCLQNGCSCGSFDANASHPGNCCVCTGGDLHGNQFDGSDIIRYV